jgi:hypothetical protein
MKLWLLFFEEAIPYEHCSNELLYIFTTREGAINQLNKEIADRKDELQNLPQLPEWSGEFSEWKQITVLAAMQIVRYERENEGICQAVSIEEWEADEVE